MSQFVKFAVGIMFIASGLVFATICFIKDDSTGLIYGKSKWFYRLLFATIGIVAGIVLVS